MRIIKGDLIKLSLKGKFDVIAHGCNCLCTQKAGIAKQMVDTFGTNDPNYYAMENIKHAGKLNKLGCIDFAFFAITEGRIVDKSPSRDPYWGTEVLAVVNCYTQYLPGEPNEQYGIPLDYDALRMCMRKMYHRFGDMRYGFPWIGCGLAGGDQEIVKEIIEAEIKSPNVTIVEWTSMHDLGRK